MVKTTALDRKYEYRRMLPHYQKLGWPIFITFCKLGREPFPAAARRAILEHCLHDHGKRILLHAAAVMPDHVHLLLTPMEDEQGWPYALPAVLKLIKGVLRAQRKQIAASLRPSLAGRKLRSRAALDRELCREVGIHPPKPGKARLGVETGRLSVAMG